MTEEQLLSRKTSTIIQKAKTELLHGLTVPFFGGLKVLGWPKSLFGFFCTTLREIPNELFGQSNKNLKRHLYIDVHCSLIQDSQKVGPTQVSTDGRLDK